MKSCILDFDILGNIRILITIKNRNYRRTIVRWVCLGNVMALRLVSHKVIAWIILFLYINKYKKIRVFFADLMPLSQVMIRFPTLDHLVSRCSKHIIWCRIIITNTHCLLLAAWLHPEKCYSFRNLAISFKTGRNPISDKKCKSVHTKMLHTRQNITGLTILYS